MSIQECGYNQGMDCEFYESCALARQANGQAGYTVVSTGEALTKWSPATVQGYVSRLEKRVDECRETAVLEEAIGNLKAQILEAEPEPA